MSRPVRLHIPHATYLIQLRARQGVSLFSSETDRKLFLDCMGDAATPAGVQIYAFSLMEHAVLIFLRSGHLPLSRFVHRMQAGYFNRIRVLHGGSQALIHDRHREILVEDGPLFLHLVRRVHLAPIIGGRWSNESEARRWGEVSTNRWTSFPVITGAIPAPTGFNREETLGRLARFDNQKPVDVFYRFIIMGAKNPGPDILDRVVAMSLLGSEDFVKKYYEGAKGRRNLKLVSAHPEINGNSKSESYKRFRKVIRVVAEEFGVKPKELLKARSRHPGRQFAVELAVRHALDHQGIKRLGERLGVSGSALAHLRRAFHEKLATQPETLETLTRLEAKILQS